MSAKVYFSDMHVKMGDSMHKKFERLIVKAGIDQIDFKDKFVAVKLHFGEVGNMAFLRHQYARVLCDHIKGQGGKPFLTDCNTLYVGYRNNALNHLDAAYMNGYNPLCTGVHTIIADGLRGTDERDIPVPGGEYVKSAKIGAAVAEADIIISLTHFKGHIYAGFGGVLKNIGMGCGSKQGKMEMHSSGTPRISKRRCIGCGPTESIVPKWDEAKPVMNKKIAEYAKAVLAGKPSFHISMLTDVSPECDCDSGNDIPIIPDVGMFASFDPIALDQACVDAANQSPVVEGSAADKHREEENHQEHDVFKLVHPDTDWEAGLIHGEKIGLGRRAYEIIRV